MSSGERSEPVNRSIEDWLAQKLAGHDEDDSDAEPPRSPELPPLSEDLGPAIDDAEQTMQATVDATLPADLRSAHDDPEHTRESIVEPSVPIPWPDWQPDPLPAFDAGAPAVPEPSLPIPGALPDPLTPPPWESDTDPENTSTLLRDDTPPRSSARQRAPVSLSPGRESPATPPRPKVPTPDPVRQLAPAPSRAPAPGRAVARQGPARIQPVADPRPTTKPQPRYDLSVPQATTWEEHVPDGDTEVWQVGPLEAVPHGNFDEVFPPPRRPGSLEEWGPTAIGRTAGGTPRDPPTVRETQLGEAGLTAPRSWRRSSEEATDIRGFTAPAPPDSSPADDQPTQIIRPRDPFPQPSPRSSPAPEPPPLAPEDDHMTTLLAWTGASVGIIAFIFIVGVSLIVANTLGWLEF